MIQQILGNFWVFIGVVLVLFVLYFCFAIRVRRENQQKNSAEYDCKEASLLENNHQGGYSESSKH